MRTKASTAAPPQADVIAPRRRLRFYFLRRNFELFLLTVPALLVLVVYRYLPMFGVVIAFKDFKPRQGILGSPWIGFENFEFFFRSSQVWNVTRNTLLYNVAFIVTTMVVGVIFAIMLYEIGKSLYIKIYQTIFFFPYFLSWVVVAIILYAFLSQRHGMINQLLLAWGGEKISWYSEPGYWPFILVFMNLWKSTGYTTVIYYAGLMGIDPELFEAATVDGATRLQKTFRITLPMLSSVLVVLLILQIGHIFYTDFGLFYQLPLQSGLLLPTTDVINYFTYRALIQLNDIGMSSAVGLYQSVMGFILVIVSNRVSRRISGGETGLF